MANRRITEFPAINGLDINEQDLLTLVHVFEVDPTLRNKKITFEQFKDYLNIYYASTSGTTFSGNIAISGNLTVSGLGSFGTILSSGLSTFSGIVVQNNAVVSGTVSGATITGTNLQGVNVNATTVTTTTATGTTALFTSGQYQSLSGATITGEQGSFTSGTFVNLSGATITGTTVAATTGAFQTLSTPVLNISGNLSVASGLTVSGTAQFTSTVQVTGTLSGTTVTGTAARFTTVTGVTGIFTTTLSGTTITGTAVRATSITGATGTFTTRVSGALVTGNTGSFGNVSGISGVFTQFLSGAVITGDAGRFTVITGVSGVYTNLSGATVTGDIVTATSITGVTGVFTSRISGVTVTGTTAQFTTISGVSGVFTTDLSGATITGDSVQASGLTAGTGNFVRVSGTTVTGDTGAFTNLTGIVGVFTTSVSGTTVISTTVTGATGTFTSLTGTTITGTTVNATTGVFNTLQAVNLSFTNTTVSGNLTVVGSGYFGSGVSVTGTISGITVTGTSGQFTNITADTANFTTATGVTASFTTITGVTVTGTTANFTSGNFVSFSGGTYIATSGVFASGTAANPSISILGDADTGVYSPGANQLAITTSGTGRLFVDPFGFVGIGKAVPQDDLHIASTTPAVLLEETDAGTDEKYWRIRAEGSILRFEGINDAFNAAAAWLNVTRTTGARTVDNIAFSTGTTERLRITSAGNVGIGTSIGTWTPGVTLDVRSGSNNTAVEEIVAFARPDALVRASINKGIVSGNGISFGTTTNHPLALRTNALERIVIGATGTTTLTSDASNAPFIANIGASEVARIDSSGKLLVGSTLARANFDNITISPQVQVEATSRSFSSLALIANGSTTASNPYPSLFLGRSRGAISTNVLVLKGDTVGGVSFQGNDGSEFVAAALITGVIDGVAAADSMPGRIVLSTTPDGDTTPVERLRITSAGRVGVATTAPAATAHIAGNTIVSNVDLANASYDSVSFSVATEETSPTGIFFSPDGRKMYVVGSTGDDVNEYNLATPWLVSSAVYSTVFSVSGQDTSPQDLYFRNDGKKLYIMGGTNDAVYQYSLSTPWSIASASYDSISFAVGTQDISPNGVFLKPDGLLLYVLGSANDTVYQYTLGTAWNVSTAVVSGSFSVLAQETSVNAISFTADGSRMFIMGSTGDDVNIYDLTTPWDVTTSSFVTVFSVAAQETGPNGLFVKPDGTKFYIIGTTNDTVYQYTIPSATIDLTGTTNINGNVNIAQNLTTNGEIVGAGALTLSTADTGDTPTARLNITADGKVGIGTASPATLLHVEGTQSGAGEGIARFRNNHTTTGQPSWGIGITRQNNSTRALLLGSDDTSNAAIAVNGNFSTIFGKDVAGVWSEYARIDSSGRLLVGTSTARNFNNALITPRLQLEGLDVSQASFGLARNSANTGGPVIGYGKSRGTVAGSMTAVIQNDDLGRIQFQGADGTQLQQAAEISAHVDGTPGATVMPGRLIFSTTSTTPGASPTERMRITSAGQITINNADAYGNLTIKSSSTFNTSDAPGSTTLYLSSQGTVGENNYGASIGFTKINSLLRPGAAIGVVQTSADEDQCGLAFFTHNVATTGNTMYEAMRLGHAGTLTINAAASTPPIVFNQGPSEVARIDSSGRMLVGTSSARTVDVSSTTMIPQLQLEGLSAAASSFSIIRNEAGSSQPYLVLGKSRSGSLSGATAVVTNDALGAILFEGTDGTAMVEAASVNAEVDGTVASGVMPGRLIFSTTASGASSPSERFRIASDGVIARNQPAPAAVNATATLTIANLKAGIITSTSALATDMTLPTGTDTQAGFSSTYDNFTFEWSVINTGPSLVRVLAGTAHTVVGSGSVATGTSGRFATRRTAANTFTSYRLS